MDTPLDLSTDSDLLPEEGLFAAIIQRAVKDARQDKDYKCRVDALQFLWACVPLVAKRLQLPESEIIVN